ncbi:hypothetical protein CHUAL_002456 [Chamberlinius hualienensis]
MADPVVVSFGDALIRLSEWKGLSKKGWLTDNIISFFFEYMSKTIFANDTHRFTFVGPDFTQLLKLCDDSSLKSFVEAADFRDKEYAFFPINDSVSEDSPGGSHWSLLVCNFRDGWGRHYDSQSSMNDGDARVLFNRLTKFLVNGKSTYEEASCPQQNNGYDCGVHVIVNARVLAKHYLMENPITFYKQYDYSLIRKKLKYIIGHVHEYCDILD